MNIEPAHVRFPRRTPEFPKTLCGTEGGSVSFEHHAAKRDPVLTICRACAMKAKEMLDAELALATDEWGREL